MQWEVKVWKGWTVSWRASISYNNIKAVYSKALWESLPSANPGDLCFTLGTVFESFYRKTLWKKENLKVRRRRMKSMYNSRLKKTRNIYSSEIRHEVKIQNHPNHYLLNFTVLAHFLLSFSRENAPNSINVNFRVQQQSLYLNLRLTKIFFDSNALEKSIPVDEITEGGATTGESREPD